MTTHEILVLMAYSKCSKILNYSYLSKRHRQTVQTHLRLHLKKQSDLGLPCLLLEKNFVTSSADNQYFVCEQKKKSVRNFRTFTVCVYYAFKRLCLQNLSRWARHLQQFLSKFSSKTIRIYYECEDGIEKSVARITDWHHEAC